MTFGYLNNLNSNYAYRSYPNFRAESNPAETQERPIDKLEKPIEKLVERVDEEKQKPHNRTAMAVGSSVLGLSVLVALLNPRVSSKLIENLKSVQLKSKQKLAQSKGSFVSTKFYKSVTATLNWTSRFVSSINNVNSVKDTYYKQLCTEEKTFRGIKNLQTRERLKKVDNVFMKIMKKPHELITKWGDSLAKLTVRNGYKTAVKKMDGFEAIVREYSKKLPEDKKRLVEEKLQQITSKRAYFTEESINARLKAQEGMMEHLDADIRARWHDYLHGFRNKYVKNSEHFDRNLSFWAQDIMQPEREKVVSAGTGMIDSFVGNKDGIKGEYRELIELLSENISIEEKNMLEKTLSKTEKSMRRANTRECCEYFDKKRDLILGSAPTDILSSAILLGIGGITLVSADEKDKRISRLITSVIPTAAGIGTNIALTTMLFSGTKGLLAGVAAGGILSLIGSRLDKVRLSLKQKQIEGSQQNMEVENVEQAP